MNILNLVYDFILRKEFWGPLITISCGFLAYQIFKKISERILLKGKDAFEIKRRATIIELIKNIFRYVFAVLVILIILQIFGVDTRTLIAGLGIIGLIIGLGLQDTIRDLISGLTIIMDNHFVVGDTIMHGNFKGEVISIGLRTTAIRSYSGEMLFLANRTITTVINYSQKSSQIVFEIITPYEESIEKIEKIFMKMAPKIEALANVEKKSTEYLGIKDIPAQGVKHMFKVKCKRLSYYQVKREAIKVIKEEFDKKNVRILIV